MSESVFTKIRKGDIPGVVLHEDHDCFVILTNMPHNPGHLLVVPINEVADWYDLDDTSYVRLMKVAKYFGCATKYIYNCPKVSLVSAGFEVPHVHIHVFSLFGASDIDHESARPATIKDCEKEANKFIKYINENGGIPS